MEVEVCCSSCRSPRVAIKGGSRGFGKIVRDQTRAKAATDKIHQLNVELQSTVDRLQSTQTALQAWLQAKDLHLRLLGYETLWH